MQNDVTVSREAWVCTDNNRQRRAGEGIAELQHRDRLGRVRFWEPEQDICQGFMPPVVDFPLDLLLDGIRVGEVKLGTARIEQHHMVT